MVENTPEDSEPSDSARTRRAPPTIDVEATEVGEPSADGVGAESKTSMHPPRGAGLSSASIGAFSGACAAALVLGAAAYLGWPGELARPSPQPVNTSAMDDLAARVASVEAKANRPAAASPDSAAAARVDGLEKSVGALRGELAAQRTDTDKLAATVNEVKTKPREAASPPDLTEINVRIAAIERATRAQGAAIAQENAKPADDVPLRRVVAAALLDVLVRTGDPYPAALATAKSLVPGPEALKPLGTFAESGVPSPAALSRELLTLVPKLSPPIESSGAGSSLRDRLQSGAVKLVKIERTDAVGNQRENIVARVTAAALRNDYSEARRELNKLSSADRAAAQAWIEKADARDAALGASRQFAAEAMTALAKQAP